MNLRAGSAYCRAVYRDSSEIVPGAWLLRAARDLRRRSTPSERRLWSSLRRHRPGNHQFRRQHPIGPYIADFVCLAARLVVEVDGGIHEEQRDSDAERDQELTRRGYTVLRIAAEQVIHDLDGALAEIERALANSTHADREDQN